MKNPSANDGCFCGSACLIFVVLVPESFHLQLDAFLFFLDARQLALRFVQLCLHVVKIVDVLFLFALELYENPPRK